MFNIKDFLLTKSFKEEQYENELSYIVRRWFNNLLINEGFVTDDKEAEKYDAVLNGKPYYLYPYGNRQKFVLVPKVEDLFSGDFDDIITFYKNDDSLFLDIKNKTDGLYTDTTYSITMDGFNDNVKCLAIYKEFMDKDNYIYEITQEKRVTNPYEFFRSLQIKYSDYWYKAAFTRTPTHTQYSERDDWGNTVTKKIEMDNSEEFDNSTSMINIVDHKLNRDYGTKKHRVL